MILKEMKMTDLENREAFDKWYGIKPKGWVEATRYNTAWKAAKAESHNRKCGFIPKLESKK